MHAPGKRLEAAIAAYEARLHEMRRATERLATARLEVARAKWAVVDHEIEAERLRGDAA
jgi:exonuclease VII small subunit